MLDTTQPQVTDEPEHELVESEQPAQSQPYRWEFKPRQHPRWGTVTKQGLLVGRGAGQKVVPPDEVYQLAALGCSSAEIARWFGVKESTLKYNFADYIEKAQEELKQKLRRAQLRIALDGNCTMLIFLGKNLLGQSDNPNATALEQPLPWHGSDTDATD